MNPYDYIKRNVMVFLVPTEPLHITSNSSQGRQRVPMYINPQSFVIRDQKIVRDTQTKGGFMVQYWGERLPTINASGEGGSGGIEAINILRDVYRNEHFQVKKHLLRRIQASNNAVISELNNPANIENVGSFATELGNILSQGGVGNLIEGFKSTINATVEAFERVSAQNTKRVVAVPNLAAYATSIDLYFQGEQFRGYFEGFTVTERANTPGLFDYNFSMKVTRRTGRRSNFMPWHRNPRDSSGNARPASIPIEKENMGIDDGLSFPTTYIKRFQSKDNVSEGKEVGPPKEGLEPEVDPGGVTVPLNRSESSKK